ncbi:hypothetical protein VTI74DRAFT_8319 [Chaetomium olivicolor]
MGSGWGGGRRVSGGGIQDGSEGRCVWGRKESRKMSREVEAARQAKGKRANRPAKRDRKQSGSGETCLGLLGGVKNFVLSFRPRSTRHAASAELSDVGWQSYVGWSVHHQKRAWEIRKTIRGRGDATCTAKLRMNTELDMEGFRKVRWAEGKGATASHGYRMYM